MNSIENPTTHIPLVKYAKEKQVKLNEENIYRNFNINPLIEVKGLVSHLEFHPTDFGKYLTVHNTMVDIANDEDEVIHSYTKFGGVVHSANFRKDGIVFVAGDEEGKIRLLRTDTSSAKRLNVPLRNFVAHQAPIHSVRFHNNDQILSCSDDKTSGIWNILSSKMVNQFIGHKDYIRSSCIIQENMISTGSYDHTIKIWDVKTNKLIQTLNHESPVEKIIKHPTSPLIITSGGNYFKVWDMLTWKSSTFKTHQNTITSLAINKNGTRLFTGGLDSKVRIYDVNDYSIVHTISFENPIVSMAIDENENRLITGTTGGIMKATRKDKLVSESEYKYDVLTTLNYRNMISSLIQEQVLKMKEEDDEKLLSLQKYSKYLRKFDYKSALNECIKDGNPTHIVSLIQEINNRNELYNAVESRNEDELIPILKFIIENIQHPNYSNVITTFTEVVLDIYTEILNKSEKVNKYFRLIRKKINQEIQFQQDLIHLRGAIDTLMLSSSLID